MAGWIDIPGAVAGTTVYSDGTLVARNATVTLPEVTMTTVELPAGGTVELPIPGKVNAMEATVTMGAADDGFGLLSNPVPHEVEVRWVQQMVDVDGKSTMVGYKAFMKAYAKTVPGVSLEVGSAGENEVTLGCIRYRLVADGEEILLIDQINEIFTVHGQSYADYQSML